VSALANKAYLSNTRALAGHYVKAEYANYKNVNLTYLARGFGLYQMKRTKPDSRTEYDDKQIEIKRKRMQKGINDTTLKANMEFE